MAMCKCPKCSSEKIDHGNLGNSAIITGYLSDVNKKMINLRSKVVAYVCQDCGYTELFTDLKKKNWL
ncbi:hypothetical protein H6802_00640 [Candidatus Nomurabacteria bacterium]|nr:hypothetical protein [Candidatus Nomurabacteria bacterium]MCB9827739.1 hypothetical protein [Candidatus Nomurabacteria bacterium]